MSSSLSKKHLCPLCQNELIAVFGDPDFAIEIEHRLGLHFAFDWIKKSPLLTN